MENYQHRDYLRMIITGLIYHNDYLPSYLRREQKKAKNDYIEFSEFLGRTITVVQDLEGEFRRLKDQKKKELETEKNGENDEVIDLQINNLLLEDIKLNVVLYTENEFKGELRFWDISKIRDAINEAFEFYSFEGPEEKGPIEFIQKHKSELDPGEENKSFPVQNPYPEVFKSLEGFLLFQRLHENNKNSRTLLADFSFIYRRMYQDNFLHDHQTPEVFRRWISNEPYEVVLDNYFKTLDKCNTKGKEDNYHNAKLLVQKEIN